MQLESRWGAEKPMSADDNQAEISSGLQSQVHKPEGLR